MGFVVDPNATPVAFAAANPAIASQNQPSRFANLPPEYLIAASEISNQLFFFRAPELNPKLLDKFEKTKQTQSVGEFLTQYWVTKLAPDFTGPVFVIIGENDMPNCFGNCMYPTNKPAAVKHMG